MSNCLTPSRRLVVIDFSSLTIFTEILHCVQNDEQKAGEWLLRSHPLPPLTRSPPPPRWEACRWILSRLPTPYESSSLATWQAGGGKNVTLTSYSSPDRAIPQPSGQRPVKPKNLPAVRPVNPKNLFPFEPTEPARRWRAEPSEPGPQSGLFSHLTFCVIINTSNKLNI